SGFRMGEVLPVGSTAEVSRFAISKLFRRQIGGEGGSAGNPHPALQARLIPNLSLALILAVTRMALAHGITHVCAVMEPALLRLLHRLGIEFTPLGPPVEYHGLRQPCFAPGVDLLEQLRAARPDYWRLITDGGRFLLPRGIEQAFQPTAFVA